MIDISAIIAFLQSAGFIAFISSYSSSKGLDLLVDIVKKRVAELSPEEQFTKVIALSLRDTCFKFKKETDLNTVFNACLSSLKSDIGEINHSKLKSSLVNAINSNADSQADAIFEYWTKRFNYHLTQPKHLWLFNYINNQYQQLMLSELGILELSESRKYENYKNQLMSLIFKKVPFDSFSIDDIYVPLLGYYNTFSEYNDTFFPDSFFEYNVVSSEDWILNWIENCEDYNILLLSGKPASGKTTLMKRLAHLLILRNYFTVIVPMKSFYYDANIAESVKRFCIENTGVDPFKRGQSANGIVLLFDGLDELSLRGVDSMKKASDFVNQIIMSYLGKEIKIIISGRSLSITSIRKQFRSNGCEYVLHLLPLYTDPDYVDCYWSGTSGSEIVDLRPNWWEKYGRIRNVDYSELSTVIMDSLQCDVETYNEITGEPFLLYLLAYSYESKVFDYSQHVSVADLYEFFVMKVYKNAWKEPNGAAPLIEKTVFIEFLQEVAICSWHSGSQIIPLREVEARCNELYFNEIIKRMADNESTNEGIINLLLLFYIDERSDNQGERSFEFSHKSFCDFFIGKMVVNSILKYLSNPYTKDTYDKLMDSIGRQYLDLYIDNFMRAEFSKIYKEDKVLLESTCARITQLFPKFISHNRDYCMVITKNGHDYVNRNSIILEKNLFRILCVLAQVLDINAIIPFENTSQFKDWVNSAISWFGDNIDDPADFNTNVMKLIARIDFADKNGLVLSGIQLQNYEIGFCKFENVGLDYASLRWANITHCDFIGSDFGGADFTYAHISEIKYLGGKTTKFSDAIFTNATISDSTFFAADFSRANFSNAKIQNTIFEECIFHKPIFINTSLKQVKFKNCKFDCLMIDSTIEHSSFINNISGIQLLSSSMLACKLYFNKKVRKISTIAKDKFEGAIINLM